MSRWILAAVLLVALATTAPAQPLEVAAPRDAAAWLPAFGEDARVIVLGELRGTREAPALAEALVRRHLAAREPVTLALEIAAGEQARIDSFLDSTGDAAARSALLSGPFWAVPPLRSDGRRSVAILGLLDAARSLRRDGAELRVLAFDAGLPGGGPDERNRRMASRLRGAIEGDVDRAFVVLIGNYHARRGPPAGVGGLMPGQSPPVPTMAHLDDLPVLRVNVTARGGEFWACMAGACGPRPVQSRSPFGAAPAASDAAPRFLLTPTDTSGWDAQLLLPAFSVAEPVLP